MNAKTIILTSLFSVFAISCASKKAITEAPIVAIEKPAPEIKKELHTVKKSTSQKGYTCLVKDDKRHVLMEKTQARCEVHYTKAGEKSKVAWGESTPSICDDVYLNIRQNIENKGFKCQDISSDQQTASNL